MLTTDAAELIRRGAERTVSELGAAGLLRSGELATLPTASVRVDPERFQFKLHTSRGGTTPVLQDAARWNPDLAGVLTVWRDPADGCPCVINGHHRFGLAVRCGVEALNVRFVAAADATEARTIGALQNIAEDKGTPIDAAKLLRDGGLSTADLAAYGVPRDGRLMRQALQLVPLPDALFHAAAVGRLPLEVACAIGSSGGNHAAMNDLHRLATTRRWSAAKVAEAAELARHAHTRGPDMPALPGFEQWLDRSDLEPLLEIRAEIRRQLCREARVFGVAAGGQSAELLEVADVAVIGVQAARDHQAMARVAASAFTTLCGRGRLAGLIAEMAEEAAGEPSGPGVAAVVVAQMQAVRAAIEADMHDA